MVIEFLKELREEYLVKKFDYESEQNNIQIKLDEIIRFIQKLKEEAELNFDVFSPRKQNSDWKERVSNLENEKETLSQKLEKINDELEKINHRLSEFDSAIEEASKQNSIEEEKEIEIEFTDSNIWNARSILKRLELCKKLVQSDSNRCKMELSIAAEIFSEMITDALKKDKIGVKQKKSRKGD